MAFSEVFLKLFTHSSSNFRLLPQSWCHSALLGFTFVDLKRLLGMVSEYTEGLQKEENPCFIPPNLLRSFSNVNSTELLKCSFLSWYREQTSCSLGKLFTFQLFLYFGSTGQKIQEYLRMSRLQCVILKGLEGYITVVKRKTQTSFLRLGESTLC